MPSLGHRKQLVDVAVHLEPGDLTAVGQDCPAVAIGQRHVDAGVQGLLDATVHLCARRLVQQPATSTFCRDIQSQASSQDATLLTCEDPAIASSSSTVSRGWPCR